MVYSSSCFKLRDSEASPRLFGSIFSSPFSFQCNEAINVLALHGVPLNGPALELCSFAACQLLSANNSIPQIQPTMQANPKQILISETSHKGNMCLCSLTRDCCFFLQKLRDILYQLVSTLTLDKEQCPPQGVVIAPLFLRWQEFLGFNSFQISVTQLESRPTFIMLIICMVLVMT